MNHGDHSNHNHAGMLSGILNTTLTMVVDSMNMDGKNDGHQHHHHHHHGMGSMDGNSTDMDMMLMYFHGGFKEVILFDFWRTRSVGIFVLSCVILFVAGALYEGLKLLRETLIRNEIINQTTSDMKSTRNDKGLNNVDNKVTLLNNNNNNTGNNNNNNNYDDHIIDTINSTEATVISKRQAYLYQNRSRLLSRGHIIQTFLHMLQVAISYLLMLVFMTYNSWLCLSIVLGAGIGYFFFGFKRLTTIDVNEHCH